MIGLPFSSEVVSKDMKVNFPFKIEGDANDLTVIKVTEKE
jgi:hypothetical protein